MIFSPKLFTAQIICQNGTHFHLKTLNTQKVLIPDFCSENLINHTISSDGNIRIPLQDDFTSYAADPQPQPVPLRNDERRQTCRQQIKQNPQTPTENTEQHGDQ